MRHFEVAFGGKMVLLTSLLRADGEENQKTSEILAEKKREEANQEWIQMESILPEKTWRNVYNGHEDYVGDTGGLFINYVMTVLVFPLKATNNVLSIYVNVETKNNCFHRIIKN